MFHYSYSISLYLLLGEGTVRYINQHIYYYYYILYRVAEREIMVKRSRGRLFSCKDIWVYIKRNMRFIN